jgi:DtxR family Mn-dependent transcriptional regulator
MNSIKETEEHLEWLWNLRENNRMTVERLKDIMSSEFSSTTMDVLQQDGYITIAPQTGDISFTEKGEQNARRIIRAHRIAERLVCDVLRGNYEAGACEFEHTINPELVDSICTLLGHPNECPHGKPIPPGECCKRDDRMAQSSVIPLSELDVAETARIAYVFCRDDQQMHLIDGLQIRPGALIKLHQKYPTFVIECEGASIALDEKIADNIRVWTKGVSYGPPFAPKERGFFSGSRKRKRRRFGKGCQ